MADPAITRREFVRDGAMAAAGAAVGLSATATVRANNPEKADTTKIVNYNRHGISPPWQDEPDDLGRLYGWTLETRGRGGASRLHGKG